MPIEAYNSYLNKWGDGLIKSETFLADFTGNHNELDDAMIITYLNDPANEAIRNKILADAKAMAFKRFVSKMNAQANAEGECVRSKHKNKD